MLIPIYDSNRQPYLPMITYAIIVANLVAFIQQLRIGLQASIFQAGVIPWELIHFQSLEIPSRIHPLATIPVAMFRHGGMIHFLGNMLYLWIFGHNVEYALGRAKFALLYLASGMVGMLCHALTNPSSMVPAVGASGAIAGLLGAYILLFPRARIRTILFIIFFIQFVELPAVIVVGLWAILQAFEGLVMPSGLGGVAVFAHLGGFVFGCMIIDNLMRRHLT